MFCPSCGSEYTQKTNYCKRCGEDLGLPGATDAPKRTPPNVMAMFWGVIAFCFAAMMLLLVAYDYFSSKHSSRCNGLCGSDEKLLTFVMFFSSAVALLLIWQLGRMVTAFRRTGQEKIVEKHFIREAPPVQPIAPTSQIPEVPKAIEAPSVIEHTTRQMANLYERPKAAE
jgi:hypothetical protein